MLSFLAGDATIGEEIVDQLETIRVLAHPIINVDQVYAKGETTLVVDLEVSKI